MALKIASVLDYVILVKGEYNWKEQQFFQIKNKPQIKAVVIQASYQQAYLLFNNQKGKVEINDELVEIPDFDKVATSMSFFGKIIDLAGNIIEPSSSPATNFLPQRHSAFATAAGVLQRELLDRQIYTGILAIDLFNPVGFGQRELIVGDRQTGKTHIGINAIINQKDSPTTKCIYVSIGQKRQNLVALYHDLVKNNAMANTIVIHAPSTSPFDQYLVPYFAMAHAENLSYNYDVLVVFDDLSKHASVWREVALLTNQPIGKEAFPADIFFAHSKLLERSGKFIGRKSITALPILQTVDNDITSLVSSNVISITDGQIITSSALFAEGKIPAINIGLSVSRTGSSIQAKNIRAISKEISSLYYNYQKQIKLAKLDYDLNKETSDLLFKGQQVEQFLVQKGYSYYSPKSVLMGIKIISWGLLKDVADPTKVVHFVQALVENDPFAKQIFQKYTSNEFVDDELAASYFATVVNQFLAKSTTTELDVPLVFPKMEEAFLNEIIKKAKNLGGR
ncbi:MSC_0619 family F1-like ATPase alpha subunit [Mycoplasma sp. 'Moose RK']|uniref:MSC_0619 family F1-like ATPase alpha subunit n=1 Tax=Mycoplasma sp. 'Moose RK' TaxID=2780095 RepID=UPI0018C1D85E|nr:ATP F0F1 synthase subunit alpha [Mycoplasma sp. 'Moose RK']MBG0730853.1 ATP F0F1 synthase subunit alpha [Mycoplasma sp. 'Moose RK']